MTKAQLTVSLTKKKKPYCTAVYSVHSNWLNNCKSVHFNPRGSWIALTSESLWPQREQTPVFCAFSKCGDIELPIL